AGAGTRAVPAGRGPTATATGGRRCGSTAASSAAGVSDPTVGWRSSCSNRSTDERGARSMRQPPDSTAGWTAPAPRPRSGRRSSRRSPRRRRSGRRRQLAHGVADANLAPDADSGVHAPQAQLLADLRVDEANGIDAELVAELGAAVVRFVADLEHHVADRELGARRQVGHAEVEVDV